VEILLLACCYQEGNPKCEPVPARVVSCPVAFALGEKLEKSEANKSTLATASVTFLGRRWSGGGFREVCCSPEAAFHEKASARSDQWRERIAAQKRIELSVRRFCKEQGIAEHFIAKSAKLVRGEVVNLVRNPTKWRRIM
jgi:hypothetical protein